jgi:hypothetical protein
MNARNLEIARNNAKVELIQADLNLVRAKSVLAAANKEALTSMVEFAELDLAIAQERVEVALAAKVRANAELRFARACDQAAAVARVNAIPARLERWINNL